jgi:hypothetical protein
VLLMLFVTTAVADDLMAARSGIHMT